MNRKMMIKIATALVLIAIALPPLIMGGIPLKVLVTVVVDTINIQNKKVELQIMTSNYNLSNVVLANIPHGCTILDAKGGYTGKSMFVIYMSVRKSEAKKVVKICRKADPHVFINVMPMESTTIADMTALPEDETEVQMWYVNWSSGSYEADGSMRNILHGRKK